MTTIDGTPLVEITHEEAEQFTQLFELADENSLFPGVNDGMQDAIFMAARHIAKHGLPTHEADRRGALAAMGEMFLSHLHAALEAEVSEKGLL